jgi:hypothetical protein
MLARDGRESDNRYAGAAARLLIDQQQQGDDLPLPEDRQRDAVVAAMALAIAGRIRRRRIVIASAVTFAAAAGVALAVGLAWRPSTALVVDQVSGQGNVLVHMASMQSLSDRQKLQPGDSVRSGEGGTASFGFANGTKLALTPSSDLRIDEVGPTRRFFLFSGGVHARVSKLGRGERFVVDTPDSEVEVHGTVFTVGINPPSASCLGAATSKVEVSEGTVWVRSGEQQVVLRAGESWSARRPGGACARRGPWSGGTWSGGTWSGARFRALRWPQTFGEQASLRASVRASHRIRCTQTRSGLASAGRPIALGRAERPLLRSHGSRAAGAARSRPAQARRAHLSLPGWSSFRKRPR